MKIIKIPKTGDSEDIMLGSDGNIYTSYDGDNRLGILARRTWVFLGRDNFFCDVNPKHIGLIYNDTKAFTVDASNNIDPSCSIGIMDIPAYEGYKWVMRAENN